MEEKLKDKAYIEFLYVVFKNIHQYFNPYRTILRSWEVIVVVLKLSS